MRYRSQQGLWGGIVPTVVVNAHAGARARPSILRRPSLPHELLAPSYSFSVMYNKAPPPTLPLQATATKLHPHLQMSSAHRLVAAHNASVLAAPHTALARAQATSASHETQGAHAHGLIGGDAINPMMKSDELPVSADAQNAMRFLSNARTRLGETNERYFDILKTLRSYHEGSISVHTLLTYMSELCGDHADLLEQFCSFLPGDVDASQYTTTRTRGQQQPEPKVSNTQMSSSASPAQLPAQPQSQAEQNADPARASAAATTAPAHAAAAVAKPAAEAAPA